MGVYGSSEYSLDVYGTGDSTQYLLWYFEVEWDPVGDPDNFTDEAERMIGFQSNRGRDHLLATGGAGWERFKPGEATGTFDNSDGRFDPYNTSSPLYGFLLPGRPVAIGVTVIMPYEEIETDYYILNGIIDDIRNNDQGGRPQTQIIVKDGLEWLNRRSVEMPLEDDAPPLLMGQFLATGLGFNDVATNWTTTLLGTESLLVPYIWGNSDSLLQFLNQLVEAGAGQMFHARGGALTFVANSYDEASNTEIGSSQVLRDFELKSPWEVVRTRAKVIAKPLTTGSPEVLWQYGNEGVVATWTGTTANTFPTSPYLYKNLEPGLVPLTPPYTLTADAIFSTSGPFTTPTVDYDFLMGEEDPIDNWVDAVTDYPNFVDETNFDDIGTGLRLNFVWDGGGGWSHMVIPWVEITATPIEALDPVTATAEDTTATTTYGQKTFTIENNPFIQDQGYAQQYADWVVEQLKDPNYFPTIKIENRSDIQFALELYIDTIHLVIPEKGIDDEFRIGKISHKWLNENGFAVETTLRLEPKLDPLE